MRTAIQAIILSISLLGAPHAHAWTNSSSGNPFFEFMLMMMKMMAIMGGGSANWVNPYANMSPNMMNNPAMMGLSAMSQSQWANPAIISSTPNPLASTPQTATQSQTNNQFSSLSPTRQLDGSWTGSKGEQLLVNNGKFSLTADTRQTISGDVFINQSYLGFRFGNKKLVYEYAQKNGKLVLRDSHGALILFRRH